jgi:hypothetical protein
MRRCPPPHPCQLTTHARRLRPPPTHAAHVRTATRIGAGPVPFGSTRFASLFVASGHTPISIQISFYLNEECRRFRLGLGLAQVCGYKTVVNSLAISSLPATALGQLEKGQ